MRARLLETELGRLQTEAQRLRSRNTQLLERQRRKRQPADAAAGTPKAA